MASLKVAGGPEAGAGSCVGAASVTGFEEILIVGSAGAVALADIVAFASIDISVICLNNRIKLINRNSFFPIIPHAGYIITLISNKIPFTF
jgi:hypothetical protein